MRNFLSVDLEDYVHSFNAMGPDDWVGCESRIEIGTGRLLDMFSERDVKATWFCLGAVAERSPELIERIAGEGHEIASHGWGHEWVHKMSPDAFRADLDRSIEILEPLAGTAVRGWRAPWWTVRTDSLWALDHVADAGLTYSSSIFPARAGVYGIAGAPTAPHERDVAGGGTLWEIPPLTRRLLGRRWPAGGGFWLRTLPTSYHAAAVRAAHRDGHPAMVYVHPWELDSEQPRLPVPVGERLIHYTGLARMEARLGALLDAFDFGPVGPWVDEQTT